MPERDHFGLLEDAAFELLDKAQDITHQGAHHVAKRAENWCGDLNVIGFVVDEADDSGQQYCRLIIWCNEYWGYYAATFNCTPVEQLLHDGIAMDDPEFDDRIQHAGEMFVYFHHVEPVPALRWM